MSFFICSIQFNFSSNHTSLHCQLSVRFQLNEYCNLILSSFPFLFSSSLDEDRTDEVTLRKYSTASARSKLLAVEDAAPRGCKDVDNGLKRNSIKETLKRLSQGLLSQRSSTCSTNNEENSNVRLWKSIMRQNESTANTCKRGSMKNILKTLSQRFSLLVRSPSKEPSDGIPTRQDFLQRRRTI